MVASADHPGAKDRCWLSDTLFATRNSHIVPAERMEPRKTRNLYYKDTPLRCGYRLDARVENQRLVESSLMQFDEIQGI